MNLVVFARPVALADTLMPEPAHAWHRNGEQVTHIREMAAGTKRQRAVKDATPSRSFQHVLSAQCQSHSQSPAEDLARAALACPHQALAPSFQV